MHRPLLNEDSLLKDIYAGTMGCACSSEYEDDWMENFDICENCHLPREKSHVSLMLFKVDVKIVR